MVFYTKKSATFRSRVTKPFAILSMRSIEQRRANDNITDYGHRHTYYGLQNEHSFGRAVFVKQDQTTWALSNSHHEISILTNLTGEFRRCKM